MDNKHTSSVHYTHTYIHILMHACMNNIFQEFLFHLLCVYVHDEIYAFIQHCDLLLLPQPLLLFILFRMVTQNQVPRNRIKKKIV